MLDPDGPPPEQSGAPWEEGCPGCSHMADNLPHLAHLRARDTSLVLVSRAPLSKIAPFKARMGWTAPWYSSFGSDFNYDFHVTNDEAVAPVEYNFQDKATVERKGEPYHLKGEQPGISVFLRDGDQIFHTYSTYGRGLDAFLGTYQFLDLTAFGRQETWEDSPEGWPQYGGSMPHWIRHHDKYDDVSADSCCASHVAGEVR